VRQGPLDGEEALTFEARSFGVPQDDNVVMRDVGLLLHRTNDALAVALKCHGQCVSRATNLYAMISRTTFPATSVNRKSRPAYRYVSFS